MELCVYLSGEIHTNWREEIIEKCNQLNLPINFLSPNTNHELSDDVGVKILGEEDNKFWHDHKSAKINSIRTKNAIEQSDIVVVRFGDKYKQWNAAFDAGYAAAMSKSLIVMHSDDNQHALKEIDAMAQAVTSNVDEVVKILNYSCNAKI
jgi:YtoQ family protein|tara:strand:+ start:68 stop:517 length:450 start_codon:yes stop_codon:yes gene_type:complete